MFRYSLFSDNNWQRRPPQNREKSPCFNCFAGSAFWKSTLCDVTEGTETTKKWVWLRPPRLHGSRLQVVQELTRRLRLLCLLLSVEVVFSQFLCSVFLRKEKKWKEKSGNCGCVRQKKKASSRNVVEASRVMFKCPLFFLLIVIIFLLARGEAFFVLFCFARWNVNLKAGGEVNCTVSAEIQCENVSKQSHQSLYVCVCVCARSH